MKQSQVRCCASKIAKNAATGASVARVVVAVAQAARVVVVAHVRRAATGQVATIVRPSARAPKATGPWVIGPRVIGPRVIGHNLIGPWAIAHHARLGLMLADRSNLP